MNKNLNRKKISISKMLFSLFSFLIFFFLVYYFYNNLNKIENYFVSSIEIFSSKFNYNVNSYKINDLNNIDKNDISDIFKPYLNTSIFLVPLEDISDLILQNNWVKKVKINIDYKNTIFVEIIEYEPLGIYEFNKRRYYFNSDGKVIDYVSVINNNKKLIVFSGQSSNLNASVLLDTLSQINENFKNKIVKADFIGERRWNLLLNNGIVIKLSETQLKQSIENYLKLSNNFNYDDFANIKVIDLRDLKKAIIEYKK